MQQRHLGREALATSAIGLGCMGLSQGYGPADDDESVRAIHRALDEGITMLDTAMSYGQGHNERLVGRALAGRRDQAVVATKFGIVRDDHGVRVDGDPGHVRGYCEASLARLGTDVIDLYYLHRIDPGVPVAETVGAMAELVRDGKVRHIALSEATPGQLALAWLLAQGPDVVPIPGSRKPGRIAENAGAADVRLRPEDLRRLEELVPRSAWSGDRSSFAVPVTARQPAS
jgi:aryl-alcohol dehydrogenase-like predicted oxidoreductase